MTEERRSIVRPSLPAKPPEPEPPFRHLIDRYVHRLRRVTCTCGWQGSSVSADILVTDEWHAHLAATRSQGP